MDRRKIGAAVLVAIIVIAGAFLVLNMNNNDDDGVTDALNRKVSTSEVPTRIISCSPSITEIIYAIGIGDRLVAVTDYCDWPEDVNIRKANGSLSIMGGYYTPSVEAIGEAEPDIVLLDLGVQPQVDLLPHLEDMGLKVIVLHKGLTFEEVYQNIEMIGEICWEEQAAADLIDSMQNRLASIQEAIGDLDEEPTVIFSVWLSPIYLSGGDTFSDEMMTLAGGENAYSDMTSWPEIGIDSILDRDPDYVLVSLMYVDTSTQEVLEDLQNDTFWKETSAVKNNHVYIFTGQTDNVFSRPGPRMVDGVELMAKILHPEVFNVTIPNTMADDYTEYLSSGDDEEDVEFSFEVISIKARLERGVALLASLPYQGSPKL